MQQIINCENVQVSDQNINKLINTPYNIHMKSTQMVHNLDSKPWAYF